MLKLLIADDEEYVIEYIKTIVDWKAQGITICGCAADGYEALELAKEAKPDMALLDINMPILDGLSLTEQLREFLPELEFAVVTGYSEFEYARKALQLGAEEYLLKPFSAEELLKVIERMKTKITSKREDESEREKNRRSLLESYLVRLIVDPEAGFLEDICSQVSRLGGEYEETSFSVVQIELQLPAVYTKRDLDLWKFCIRNVVEELGHFKNIKQQILYGEGAICYGLLNGSEECLDEEILAGHFEEIQKIIWEKLNLLITVGIGTQVSSQEELWKSGQQARLACQEKYVNGAGKIYTYTQLQTGGHTAGFYSLDTNSRILNFIRTGDKNGLEKEFGQLVAGIQEQNYAYDYTYMIFCGILSIGLSFLSDKNADITQILGKDFAPYRELGKKRDVKESAEWLQDILVCIMEASGKNRSKRAEEIIRLVDQCVSDSYWDSELTVEKIAAFVHLDSSYLRRIFSKNLGCTVTDYLTEYRMKEARRLLEEGTKTVSEIAEKVGYLDQGYFSKCFKKYYGVTPSNYPVFSKLKPVSS